MAALFIATDLATILLSFGAGFFFINALDPKVINFKSFILYWPYLPFFIFELWIFGLYPGIAFAKAEELRRFSMASFIGHMGVLIALSIQDRDDIFLSLAFALSFAASIPLFLILRGWARKHFSGSPYWGVPVAVFCSGPEGKLLVDKLLDRPTIGFVPAAIFRDSERSDNERRTEDGCGAMEQYRGVPVYEGFDQSEALSKKAGVNTAIAAMDTVGSYLSGYKYSILVPNLEGLPSLWTSVRDMDGILGLHSDRNLLKPTNLFLKRAMDVSISITLSIAFFPIFLIAALLVRLGSPGPVFFAHTRLGRYGKPIKVYKFRTMYKDAEQRLKALLESDVKIREEWQASFKLKEDPRVTGVGKLLRKTSLDELPQLWNVLKGDMSLVGPRPIVRGEVDKYGEAYSVVASVYPGVSGYWQVSGRSETDYEERVALDMYYIRSWSVWLDLYIAFKTASVILGGKGAY